MYPRIAIRAVPEVCQHFCNESYEEVTIEGKQSQTETQSVRLLSKPLPKIHLACNHRCDELNS
jgi:hypothetical protein